MTTMQTVRTFLLALILLIPGVAITFAQSDADSSRIRIQYAGFQVESPTVGSRVELEPVVRLLGGELAFSPAAGTWAATIGEHVIQLAPDRRSILADGELMEASSPIVSSPLGVAVSLETLDRYILSPIGLHLKPMAEGYRIAAGAGYGDPVAIRPTAADFASTTTLVLAMDRPVRVHVESSPETGTAVVFEHATPQLNRGATLRSNRILGVVASGPRLELDLADEIGVVSWNVADTPPRVILELGRIQPTPTPAPVQIVRRRGPSPVVIDPGHGGDDTGAVSATGMSEKTITMDVARRVAAALTARGIPVRLTRNGDEKRALSDRTAVANRLEARAFISLHANASTVHSVRGAETYYMSLDDTATDADAQATATLENMGYESRPTGSTLDLILWDMAQSEVLNESADLALAIQRRLNVLQGLRDRGVKQAPFVVLTGATMPAALVEIGFLSNPDEAARMADPSYQNQLAEAIADGVVNFLERQ
jgi:N-acetylmuramoyl-L-alanine amidase